ncbi:Histone acetyltransferase HPA2 [Rhodovulum sp. P5]|uniref:GNAT family N-acetyltransferase n=1 Tax=Rhodovulum sp. P5 TaxID=1564506 RepID=UPI0009C20B08|nr:GNAT family N-acetyltransferase [Rhodovulum sp. P5]ARE40314.1 Histone acetyltransferase HPA2 [Rhodovulum sp. P5]
MSFDRLFAGQEATWPPAARWRHGPWCIRDGQGGGKRVSATTAEADVADVDVPAAEVAMAALGQPCLFMLREGESGLDATLAVRGYEVVDPVLLLSAPIGGVAAPPPPPVSAFTVWQPLAIMEELWAENGIGPARRAVMERVTGPKTAVLGRQSDRAAGVAFAAVHEDMCFVHAMAVSPEHRRKGTARNMMHAAAIWGQAEGAETLVVLVTEANTGAHALYSSLGMTPAARYHYRMIPPEKG